ncbi:MAG: ECF transporter S component [Clostridia bacterium]|nr:ECF transporter S component [Clostridiales bacterium]MBQ3232957.1 ECF transporter S component [Clostridia bacterium]
MFVIKSCRARGILKITIPFVVIPLIVLLSATVFKEKSYLLLSALIAVFSLLLFASGFEKKKTGSRRLVIVSAMTALCIVGRFIPFFKPITALTIITAIYLGGEAGFLVGALSALLSNFYFGQGPWTAFQMLAWGMIGLVAGYLSAPLKKSRALLLIYGVVSGVLFSFIMDLWSVMWYAGELNLTLYKAGLLTALPHTALYTVSNLVFLWFLARPFGEKLERIKVKYGV